MSLGLAGGGNDTRGEVVSDGGVLGGVVSPISGGVDLLRDDCEDLRGSDVIDSATDLCSADVTDSAEDTGSRVDLLDGATVSLG